MAETKRETVQPKGPGRGPRAHVDLKSIDWKQTVSTLKRLMSMIWKNYATLLIIVIIALFASSLVSVAANQFLEPLIDNYIAPFIGKDHPDFSELLKALWLMGCLYILGVFCSWLYNRLMIEISQGTLKKLRDEMFDHMQKLPINYFDTHSHGDTMSRFTNDIDTLRQLISQSMPQLLTAAITICGVLVCMIRISVLLTIIVLLMFMILTKISGKLASKSSKFFVKQQADLGKLNGFIEEMTEGQKVIKVFNHEEEAITEFNDLNNKLFNSARTANILSNIMGPVSMNLSNLIYVLIALIGSAMAINGVSALTLGKIASFLQFTKSISMPINNITQQFGSIVMGLAGADRIFNLCDEKVEYDEGYVRLVNCRIDENGVIHECEERTGKWAWKHPHHDGSLTYTELKGDVRFTDVDFGYTADKTILHNVSLFAEPGQKLAFVGSTGAGKTTITNLINRFYDIQDGKIRYDGININKINKSDLRRSLGIVLQDTNLFTGTVKESIRFGRLDATDEEIVEAAKLANADSFIRHLPQGYDTVLTANGANLSQGQRQLLSIARAAVANPPVLILDEATSSIDTRTEAMIQEGMDKLMEGRTVFVIAHRLSTVRNSNAILVLDHGRIIERGNHESLIEEKGTYYQLYTGSVELS